MLFHLGLVEDPKVPKANLFSCIITLPKRSPDPNIIENLFLVLKKEVYEVLPRWPLKSQVSIRSVLHELYILW